MNEVLMMVDFGLTILSGVLIAIITASVFWLVKAIKKDRAAHSMLSDGIKSMIRYQILMIYNEAVKNKGIHTHERDILNEMYASYKSLGGNGFITDIMDKIKDLEIIS